jgi:hypothetical protein
LRKKENMLECYLINLRVENVMHFWYVQQWSLPIFRAKNMLRVIGKIRDIYFQKICDQSTSWQDRQGSWKNSITGKDSNKFSLEGVPHLELTYRKCINIHGMSMYLLKHSCSGHAYMPRVWIFMQIHIHSMNVYTFAIC